MALMRLRLELRHDPNADNENGIATVLVIASERWCCRGRRRRADKSADQIRLDPCAPFLAIWYSPQIPNPVPLLGNWFRYS